MMTSQMGICGLCILFLLSHLTTSLASAAEIPKTLQRVLLLQSYHPGYKWTDDVNLGITRHLNRDNGIDLRIEYLDTKHYSSREYLDEVYRSLSKKYADTNFQLILAADNNALSFVLNHRREFFPDTPIVFCGINFFSQDMLQGLSNITGVNEDVRPRRTIDLMLHNRPETKRIIVISDNSVTASVVRQKIIEISHDYPQLEWSFPENSPINDLTKFLQELRPDDLVLLSLFFVDTDGRYIEYDEVARIISDASPVPVYVLWDFYLGFGVVGGFLASGSYQGEKAAEIAKMILDGIPASTIPVVQDSPNAYLVDYQVARRFDIPRQTFPPDTHFLNDPPSFYADHKLGIWLTICLLISLSLLSTTLFIAVIRQRRAESGLRQLTQDLENRVMSRTAALKSANEEILRREEQLQLLLANLPGMVYRCKNDKHWTMLFISQGVTTLTGYSPEQLLHNADLTYADIIDERDRNMVVLQAEKAMAENRQFTIEYRIQTKEGKLRWVWERGAAIYDSKGSIQYIEGFITDISDRKKSEQELIKLATAIHQADDIVIIANLDGTIEYVNPAFANITGYSEVEVVGKNPRLLKSGKQNDEVYQQLWETLRHGEVWRGRLINRKKDGTEFIAQVAISPIRDTTGSITGYVGIQHDISHEVSLENNLRQAQKLEAIGTLAGGIAHEINTPTQYVGSNVDFIGDAIVDIGTFINACRPLLQDKKQLSATDLENLSSLYEQYDLEYLLDELPRACNQSRDGIDQISRIVRSMKLFAHPGDEQKALANLNDALQNTATVCANEWKYVANLTMELDPELPDIYCHRSELNQVFLNLIINAAHAIAEMHQDNSKGEIVLTTTHSASAIIISCKDNGGGIAKEIGDRIFDPFFTTKPPGKGTGQGLAISHSIITEKHGGKLYFETETGKGTTFYIHLPI